MAESRVSKLYVLGLLLIVFLLIIYSGIEISRSITGDPPSIYNDGNGGVSMYFSRKLLSNGVSIIYSFDELTRYVPSRYILFIIGPDEPLRNNDVEYILRWTSSGGIVVVMDETENISSLLIRLGIDLEGSRIDVSRGVCRINNKTYTVVFDVYTYLSTNMDYAPICWIGKYVLGYRVGYGKGIIYIIGDSSLVINEILYKPIISKNNTLFVDQLIDGRRIILYEGSRPFIYTRSHMLLTSINGFLDGVANIFEYLLINNDPEIVLTRIIILLGISSLFILIRYGIPQSPYMYSYRISPLHKRSEIRKMIYEGVERWLNK